MMKKIFSMAALALLMTACGNDIDEPQAQQQPANLDGMITITAKLAPKSEAGTRAVTPGTDSNSKDIIKVTWAADEHLAILYEVSGVKKMADATITAVDDKGVATITFAVESGTADETPCTIVYPLAAAKDDYSGVKDAATLLANQDGTLSANLDVRVGAGTISTSKPSLGVSTQPVPQFAIVKFSLTDGTDALAATQFVIKDGSNNVLTTVTPASDANELYVAMAPATTSNFKFESTKATTTYYCNKFGATLAAGKYYQSSMALKDMLHTPLTLESMTAGTVVVSSPKSGMKYSLNGAEKTTDGITSITVKAGDNVEFFGNGTSITSYDGTTIGGTAQVKAYGNVMSLVDETGFAAATTLSADNAFKKLFNVNTGLKDASALLLPATTLTKDCYYYMFYGCTSLTTAPALPATTLAENCYYWMFYGCTSLTAAPTLPATTLAEGCYWSMFGDCTSLTTAPALPVTTLAKACYSYMFYGCTNLTTAPVLPAETLAEDCYEGMFYGCTSLTTPPTLPATALAEDCYAYMFRDCTSLTTVPAELLPAETLAEECYQEMFRDCTSLTAVPTLPAQTLAKRCYGRMFYGCTSLTTAPVLPAETLAEYCYEGMFQKCTRLATAPTLPATELADNCYHLMFKYCTSLTTAPTLPATDLECHCYEGMFQNCTSLTTAPTLPAETLALDCYEGMFQDCTSLSSVTCLATDINDYTDNWLSGVASTGTFTTPSSTNWTTGANGIPSGWTRVNYSALP